MTLLAFAARAISASRARAQQQTSRTPLLLSIGIQRAAQTVLGVYLKHTCSRDTSASSALGVLDDYAGPS